MLEKIAKKHKEWIALTVNMGCKRSDAEDVVQEMYLKINRLIEKGVDLRYRDTEEVNRLYIYRTLFSIFIDSKRKHSRTGIKTTELDENLAMVDDDIIEFDFTKNENYAFNKLTKKVLAEMGSWNSYYAILCKLYFSTDYSMRDLAKELDCGLTHIYNVVKIHREILQEKFTEDWEDYVNKDYDKI